MIIKLSGSNPCSCNDVVVQATEVTKPIKYVSPEVINEAAIIREGGSTGCSETQTSTVITPDLTTVITQTEGAANVADNVLSPSSSISSPTINLNLPSKYSSSESISITSHQTEPSSSDKNVQIVPR